MHCEFCWINTRHHGGDHGNQLCRQCAGPRVGSRFDEWGRPKAPKVEDFHDYEAAAQERTERQALITAQELVDRKARAKRVAAAVVAYGEFWGLK